MTRYVLAGFAAMLMTGSTAAQVADVNCTIAKTFRCTLQGCTDVPLNVGIRFNVGTKTGCLTKDGNCAGNLPIESTERIGDDVIVRFKGNGMILRINAKEGNMVGSDASKDNVVFAYGGTCK